AAARAAARGRRTGGGARPDLRAVRPRHRRRLAARDGAVDPRGDPGRPRRPRRRPAEDGKETNPRRSGLESMEKIRKTDEQWQQELDSDRYAILRCAATEPPWSGELNFVKEDGVFRCGACGAELFRSDAKFDSGSGWPSFFQPADEDAVETEVDTGHGMRRVEVRCAACDSHLGHVFPDGPHPTGQRYCINSLALDFEPAEDE